MDMQARTIQNKPPLTISAPLCLVFGAARIDRRACSSFFAPSFKIFLMICSGDFQILSIGVVSLAYCLYCSCLPAIQFD